MTLKIERLVKRFGGLVAVNGLTFEYTGDAPLGIVGPNGSGKTTSFNLITGFLKSDTGTIRLGDRDITNLAPAAIARLGLRRTFQQTMFFAGRTVRESLEIGMYAIGSGARDAAFGGEPDPIDFLLDMCGLSQQAERIADELPFGYSRLLGIAMALTGPCRVLLLDEPAAGMSDAEADTLARVVRQIGARGVGIIIVDHNTSFLFDLCPRVLVLDKGELIADGGPAAIRNDPKVGAAYLGVADA
ncbi:ABC transporter family protein [Paraburkholderia xenovorans LB400]|uniref:Amino acid/amide ABC transporter ATP-binding protein 1, HAAT family n=1 Tax=Paraburkholderia xenovorans (strain LB400) TaxID=266265 RepID=Q13HH6_PARXL|nr:ATP-binding cassette domain-containing protein [Paraburkholderia xenovorans]ABE36463.1 amino acid/amide ABC transporter ATP-binding protein 1, HAAT family [Paraburkholderia xenovorans LB400]AIP35070.1 ABC transporter family protein [Paraburkholderia xenovorans LB400]